jgi:hypothetical protein
MCVGVSGVDTRSDYIVVDEAPSYNERGCNKGNYT